MTSDDPRALRLSLETQYTRGELQELLGEELGATYPRKITDSLRNELMKAFFRKVGVDPTEVELPFETTTYEDLRDPSIKSYYGPEHALVTVLNHYLANRGIRDRDPVNSLSKSVMASMIADIRTQDRAQESGTRRRESNEDPTPQGEQAGEPVAGSTTHEVDEVALTVSEISDFETDMQGVDGFESDAGAYIYVLRLKRESDGSDWYYVGQATGGLSGLETRIRSHLRNPTNIQRTVVRDDREILARKVEYSHDVVAIERIEPLYTDEIRADRADIHEHGYLNPERYTSFYINEAERRIAYEMAIEKETTNVLGGK